MRERRVASESKVAQMERCETCGHASVPGKRCKICARRCAPCDDEDCAYCVRHTLADVVSARAWTSRNPNEPRAVWKSSSKRVWIECVDCGLETERIARNVGRHGCALCANRSERKLYEFLVGELKVPRERVTYQASFDWCGRKRFDFRVDERVLLELDGAQHFAPVRTWKTGFDVCHDDLDKENQAVANGFRVVRLLQEDVWHDTDDWKEYLKGAIQSVPTPGVTVPARREYTQGVYARLRCADCFF